MTIPKHILIGFSAGWRERRRLRSILDGTERCNSILELDPQALRDRGIAALALDFDGVLANHDAAQPLPEAIEWLRRCVQIFGGQQIFILSNKPTEARRNWFGSNFPTLRYISGVRKKPYPDGILQAARLAAVPPSAVLMVDDRLLTGCLAAINAGATPCYIRKPYICLLQRPLAEPFFWLLRLAERIIIRLITAAAE